MNEERWVLAQLKRWLVTNQRREYNEQDLFYSKEVLSKIAEIEAEAVLGAPTEEEIEEVQ